MFKSLFRGPADSTTSSNNQFSNIILASGSPRRKQILQNPLLGLPAFDVVPSAFEEDLDKSKLSPKDYVLQTATEKAKEVARRLMLSSNHQQHCFKLLISADTVVHSAEDGRILEKPRDKDDARQMLTGFAGKANEVLTAVVLLFPLAGTLSNIDLNGVEGFVVTTSTTTITVGQDSKFLFGMVRFVESTRVHFGSLHTSYPLLLEAYLDGGDWKDKAGGYGIQSDAAGLISRIEGCYYNVVGFPLYSFISKLLELKDKNLI